MPEDRSRRPILALSRAGALFTTGIVYGTDAFFSIVGTKALERTSASGLTEAMGRLHEVADRRMPVIGAAGLFFSICSAMVAETQRDRMLAGSAATATIAYIVLYTRLSKPINDRLVAGAREGRAVAEAHALQRRWDRVVYVRFALMSAAMLCLMAVDRSPSA